MIMSNMALVMFTAPSIVINSHSKFWVPIVCSLEVLRTKGKCAALCSKSGFTLSAISFKNSFVCRAEKVYKFPDPIPEFYGSGAHNISKSKKEWVADWVSNNDDLVRSLPIYLGGISLLAVLLNRSVSGIAAVADASSSQSRADLLTLGLAVTNILNGLVWLSIRPKSISVVEPNGVECQRMYPDLPDYVTSELLWAWESLSGITCCRSFVIIYDGMCILQIGYAAEAMVVDAIKYIKGSLYSGVAKSGSQSYLANLSLYPGKTELPFLPLNTQAVILQPLGNKGIAIVGGDTIRGFTTSDQAWITLMGEKIDATLAKITLAVQERI